MDGAESYVCLCNAITEGQVRAAAEAGAARPKEVFAARGCGPQCAKCTRTMCAILRQAAESAAMAPCRLRRGGARLA